MSGRQIRATETRRWVVAIAMVSVFLIGIGVARANIITVNTTQGFSINGNCSLLEAIQAANTNVKVDNCKAGSPGTDVINLASTTYPYRGPLQVTESLEIHGNGMGSTVIIGSDNPGPTIPGMTLGDCAAPAAVYEFIPGAGNFLQFTNLTLQETSGTFTTGLCVAAGQLILDGARVTGFLWGGIYASPNDNVDPGTDVIVRNQSLIDNNRSPGNGAGILIVSGASSGFSKFTMTQSAVINNFGEGYGGGVDFQGFGGANHIENSTISGNTASFGGGVALDFQDSYFEIDGSTIYNNRATIVGGGIYVLSATTFLMNSLVVTNNIADNDAQQANFNSDYNPTSGIHCQASSIIYLPASGWPNPPLDGDGTCRFNVSDALLAPLAGAGGPNNLPIHVPLANSPVIHAYNTGTMPGNQFGFDQRGIMRPQFVDATGTTFADVGAYELVPFFETENLSVAAKSSDTHSVITASGYHAGKGTNLQANAVGDFVTYTSPPLQAGIYAVTVQIKKGSNAGIFQLSKGETLGGSYVPILTPQDTFASSNTWTAINLGNVTISTTGQKFFKFTVTGHNGSSSGFQLFPDYLQLTKHP